VGGKIQWLWIALGNAAVAAEVVAWSHYLNFSIVVQRSEDLCATGYALDLSVLHGKVE